MKKTITIVLTAILLFSSCEKEQQIKERESITTKLNLKKNAKIGKLMASNGIGAQWSEEDLNQLENIEEDAIFAIANIGRKSRNCFGIGICEWFPKPVRQILAEESPESNIILPVFAIEEDTTFTITSNTTKEDFVIEDDLQIENLIIPKGVYEYNHDKKGYVLPVLVVD